MASMLATLETEKLVERTPSDIHAQVLVTKLTRTGHSVFHKANEAALAVDQRLSAAFTDDEEKPCAN
ncbi:hypothetical protein [Amycolatopsis sp. NPDC004378]